MHTKGNIKDVQMYNQKYIQPDVEFEFLDSIITNVIHADPEAEGDLSVSKDKIQMHILPSTPEFKQSIIDNLVKLNKLLKIKIVFSSSLKISKRVSFSLQLHDS